MQNLSAPRGAVRGVSGGAWANSEVFVGARPIEPELGLEDRGIRVRLRASADGDSRVVHPHPAANGEFGNHAQCVGEG